jgi:hypothetical protein
LFIKAQPPVSKLHVEAGASLLLLNDANLSSSLGSTVVREDDSAWAPFLAAGYSVSERWGLRLSYHYVDRVKASMDTTLVAGTESYLVASRFTDDIHIVSFGPEVRWPLSRAWFFSASPTVSWVTVRAETRTTSDAPHIMIVPRTLWTHDDLTLGGELGLSWRLSEPWSASLRYHYMDLEPSRDRSAHALSLGLQRNF